MKTTAIILSIVLCSFLRTSLSYAQGFTKITTGPVVTTLSDSRSVNWADVNNDGWEDLFISNGNEKGDNNMLFMNNGDGSFRAVTQSPITQDNLPSDGATFADFDNDGDIDAFVVNWYGKNNMLYLNDGKGNFTQQTTGNLVNDGGYSETAAWGDYDHDGWLDLYVCNSGGDFRNFLYHNNKDGSFERITEGDMVTDVFRSRCVNWVDYDNDGDDDLFVCNEALQNENLYRNDGKEGFTKVLDAAVVFASGRTMSSSWGDYDNDGDLDVILVNDRGRDMLFRNDGGGGFTEVSSVVSSDNGNGFGSNWADIDNDGDLDLFITNSFGGSMWKNFLYRNNLIGGKAGETDAFTRDSSGAVGEDMGWSYGNAFGDYDNDGDLDLAVANCYNEAQNAALYRNEAQGNGNHWLKMQLIGSLSNRSAIGTKLRLKASIGGKAFWQMREISAQSGYCGQNSLIAHFGLGDATRIDSLRIEWTNGGQSTLTNLPMDTMLTIKESEVTSVEEEKAKSVLHVEVAPNPGRQIVQLHITGNSNASILLRITDIQGNKVYEESISSVTGNMRYSLALNDKGIAAGVYFLQLQSGTQQSNSVKVIIER